MTILLFIHDTERVTVVTDTLATTPEGDPHMFVTKCWPIPHMNAIVAATGSASLLDRWVEFVRTRMIASDVVNLDHHTPDALREVWGEMKNEHDELGITATVYHFGMDPDTGQAVRFVYRSVDDFESERHDDTGFGCKPPPIAFDLADHATLPDIAEAIRAEQRGLPAGEQVFIGGDLYATTLTADGVSIEQVHRFDDWGHAWNAMCARAESD